jgi:preprotein translocase subunit SecG
MDFLVRFLLGLGLSFTAIFLILLVLIQRGRGGGLAGALGGMGGQSAFGTKAGDMFTKITIGVAAFWIVLCILATNVLGRQRSLFSSNLGSAAPQSVAPMTPADSTIPPAGDTDTPSAEPPAGPTTDAAATPVPEPTEPAAAKTDDAKPAAESAPAVPAPPQ